MTPAIWFWLFYVLSIVFGVWGLRVIPAENRLVSVGEPVVCWILFGLLGWAVFGSPVK